MTHTASKKNGTTSGLTEDISLRRAILPVRPFSMVIPPPNVTGSLHMGHALNNTLQDICHGFTGCQASIPYGFPVWTTQVSRHRMSWNGNSRKKGSSRDEVGREKFIDRVWEWKAQSGGTIIEQLKRLGCSCDWSRERFTMDEGLSRAVREVFVRLYKEGLIYREIILSTGVPGAKQPFQTLKQNMKIPKAFLYYIHYPLGRRRRPSDGCHHTSGNNARRHGSCRQPKDPRFGKYVGRIVILPIVGKKIPVIGDSYVDMEFGTGALKVTPAHDVNDFEIREKAQSGDRARHRRRREDE